MQLDYVKRLLSGGEAREKFRSAFFGRMQEKNSLLGRGKQRSAIAATIAQ